MPAKSPRQPLPRRGHAGSSAARPSTPSPTRPHPPAPAPSPCHAPIPPAQAQAVAADAEHIASLCLSRSQVRPIPLAFLPTSSSPPSTNPREPEQAPTQAESHGRATPAFPLPAPFVARAASSSSSVSLLTSYAPAPTRCPLFLAAVASANPVPDARRVFDEMPHRNTVSWGAMVSGYTAGKSSADAFELFRLKLGFEVQVYVKSALMDHVVPMGIRAPADNSSYGDQEPREMKHANGHIKFKNCYNGVHVHVTGNCMEWRQDRTSQGGGYPATDVFVDIAEQTWHANLKVINAFALPFERILEIPVVWHKGRATGAYLYVKG